MLLLLTSQHLPLPVPVQFGPEDGGLTAEEVEEGSAAFVSRLQVVAEEMPKVCVCVELELKGRVRCCKGGEHRSDLPLLS